MVVFEMCIKQHQDTFLDGIFVDLDIGFNVCV